MKMQRLVAAIAAGSLVLGTGAAFGQTDQELKDRQPGFWRADPRDSPANAAAREQQRAYPRVTPQRADPRPAARDDRRDDRRDARGPDPRSNDRADNRSDYRSDYRREYRGESRPDYRDDYRDGRRDGYGHAWSRGDRLPAEYRTRQYVVDDWRSHRLNAPPRGYHWVQSGGDYLLVAIATGVIASILLNQ